MNGLVTKIVRAIFPMQCCICEERSDNETEFCEVCFQGLPWLEDRCYRCGLGMGNQNNSVYCEKCHENPPHYDRLNALFRYDSPITKLVVGLKFGRQLAYGRILGELLCQHVKEVWYKSENLPEVIIPIPLHRSRLRQRGFNQVIELMRPLTQKLQVPTAFHYCVRLENTKPQSKLSAGPRKRNILNAFEIRSPINFKHVAIVDDVVTTGSTVNAVAKLLKAQGVQWVDVWSICRA